MLPTTLLLLTAALLPGDPDDAAALAPPTPPAVLERIVELGTRESTVESWLDHLVNGIGARLTGSRNLEEAERWTLERFRELGLDARLEQWGEVAVGFDRGPSRGALVAPEHVDLTFMTRSWSAGTDGPVRGPVVLAPRDAEELEAVRDRLPGAWVLTPNGWPPRPRGDDAPEDVADDAEARSEWIRAQLGAYREFTGARSAAYEEAGVAGQVRRGFGDQDLLLMSGNMNVAWDELPDDVSITLVGSQFDDLRARLDAGEALELEFDVDNRFREGPVPQHNVVADLVGAERPDEYVIVGGHLDSWDIAPGATDNATGVATTLEAARLLVESGARPARTIRFMLFGGEEQGLHGSRAWVAEHADEMPRISAVLVHDGGTNALAGLPVTRAMRPQMERALGPVLDFAADREGIPAFTLRDVNGLSPGASDHNPFLQEGVPGFFWDQSGRADYDWTHHTQHDVYEAAIPEYQEHSAVVVALSALGLADLPELLDRRGMTRVRRTLGVFLDGNTVTGVSGDSQAARLGVETGDVFTSVDGEPLPEGGLRAARDRGEARKVFGWTRGDETLTGVFEWDEGDIDREPEGFTVPTVDGVTIHGDWYTGRLDGPAAGSAVVLLHMNRADRHTWTPVRDELYAAGIATVAIDLRGHGDSVDAEGVLAGRVAESDPEHYAAMVHDVAAAVAWLEQRGYPAERIGLMGASVGCSVALRAANEDPRLAGVVALTPGSRYLGVDSLADAARWDDRPLALVSSEEEADVGARPIRDALLARDRWTRTQLVIVPGTGIHGTRMFGVVDGLEQELADWWAGVLAR